MLGNPSKTCKHASGASMILAVIQMEIISSFLLELKQPQIKLISVILLSPDVSQQNFCVSFMFSSKEKFPPGVLLSECCMFHS